MLRNGHRREKSHTVSNLRDGAREERSEHGARVPARGRRRRPLASVWSTKVSGGDGGGPRCRRPELWLWAPRTGPGVWMVTGEEDGVGARAVAVEELDGRR